MSQHNLTLDILYISVRFVHSVDFYRVGIIYDMCAIELLQKIRTSKVNNSYRDVLS